MTLNDRFLISLACCSITIIDLFDFIIFSGSFNIDFAFFYINFNNYNIIT